MVESAISCRPARSLFTDCFICSLCLNFHGLLREEVKELYLREGTFKDIWHNSALGSLTFLFECTLISSKSIKSVTLSVGLCGLHVCPCGS